jgi:hypothetical protein
MERDVYVPPAYGNTAVEIRTPLMNDLIQRLAGALSVNPPQFKVPPRPRGNMDKNQRLSSKLEKWTTAWLNEMEHQEGDRIYYRFLDYLCGDGHGVLKLVHREDFWDGYPTLDKDADSLTPDEAEEYSEKVANFKTGASLPFSLKVLDPLTFYPFYSERGLEEVLEVSKRPKIYLAKRFNLTAGDRGKLVSKTGQNVHMDSQISGDCEYWEHWTDKDVPYFHALGTQTSSREPDKEGLSVGHQLIHLIPALDSLLTMKTNSGFLSAYPSFKRIRPIGAPSRVGELDDDEDPDAAGLEFEPGHIYDGLPGEDLAPVELPQVGQDVNQSIEMLLGIISKVGIPSVLEGNHSPNRVSGFAYSEMLNVSRTKYTTIIRNASFAMESMVKFLWWLVEKRVGEEIYIWATDEDGTAGWLSITPSDIGEYYNVKVIIEPLLPEDDIAQGQHAASMVQAGMWSKRFAREQKMGIPDPEAMEDEILVERAMEMPQISLYLLLKALERTEQDDLKELFEMSADQVMQQIQDLASGGAAGNPGQEGLPNMAAGAGGAGMPGSQGMLNGGMPGEPPPPPAFGGGGGPPAPVAA